jgi:hypothetical protein
MCMRKTACTIQPDLSTPLSINYYTNNLKIASRTTIWQWTKQGLKTTRVGGRVYISQADLQRFMNEMTEEVNR